jgi:DNA-binding transcriptional MocR family regulator
MSWEPNIERFGKPHYAAIAEAIASDLQEGRLASGTRLPPQRELADQLGLNLTTVARGYVEAQRRGLIESRVGQGTFVTGRPAPSIASIPSSGIVDVTMNLPPEPQDNLLRERMAAGLAAMAQDLQGLLRYQVFGGSPADKEAGAGFLSKRGVDIEPDRLIVSPGTHVAFLAILQNVTRAGDTILCEAITYPGIRAVAARLGLKIEGVPLDHDGIVPEVFAALCKTHAPKAVYLNPTLLNPTAALMPVERRLEVATIAREHGVMIIEDDAYGALLEVPVPAFVSIAPDITYYVAGISKTLGAGLRVAHVSAPDQRALWAVSSAMRAMNGMASPLGVTLSTQWMRDGTADDIIVQVRQETRIRQNILREAIPAARIETHPEAFHGWMHLPEGWSRSAFIEAAKSTGLSMVASDAFTVSGAPQEALRLSLGGAFSADEMRDALGLIGYLLEHAPFHADLY